MEIAKENVMEELTEFLFLFCSCTYYIYFGKGHESTPPFKTCSVNRTFQVKSYLNERLSKIVPYLDKAVCVRNCYLHIQPWQIQSGFFLYINLFG